MPLAAALAMSVIIEASVVTLVLASRLHKPSSSVTTACLANPQEVGGLEVTQPLMYSLHGLTCRSIGPGRQKTNLHSAS